MPGDEHVDRARARTTGFTEPFQDLITRYARDELWARPGLDRRTRSRMVLTALVAHGHWDELAVHVRAAPRTRPGARGPRRDADRGPPPGHTRSGTGHVAPGRRVSA
ncbi:carboxymuconolactone decarboxylase family protein [Nocardiopsis dassonvillei]|uniref:carboxymuconolactone decarboxylase family protein n=1 Tax=Nocardiopsis dassonvillei TaxID=2014 RepID=UPI00366D2141